MVHEEELLTARAFREFRLAHETHDAHGFGRFLHGHQPLVVLAAENAHDALAFITSIQVVQLLIVVGEGEANAGVGEGHALELVDDVLQLHRVALEELAARRSVEEEVAHSDGGAGRTGRGFLNPYAAALDHHPGADL